MPELLTIVCCHIFYASQCRLSVEVVNRICRFPYVCLVIYERKHVFARVFFEHGVFAVKVTIVFVVAIVLQRKESLEEKQIMQVV